MVQPESERDGWYYEREMDGTMRERWFRYKNTRTCIYIYGLDRGSSNREGEREMVQR